MKIQQVRSKSANIMESEADTTVAKMLLNANEN